ncbi:MAG TPA: ribonuclease P protein subunit [Candidatus Nanoarchaeia archaeon]|nr:ribonuclease P protein subunit [Candidatus Nanoarchaeia archaeon]
MKAQQDEYIGATIEIVESTNKDLQGLRGKVLDETKNTFLILTDGTEKKILKKGNTFNINGKIIEGNQITKRPEERIKL